MPSDYFDEGLEYMDNSDHSNAITSFDYIVKNYPGNELYPRALYNVGYLYYIEKQYDSSIVIFKSILASNVNEKEERGGSIMDNPYTNYHHESAEILSMMYKEKQQYDTALYYFSLADTVYPFLHFCGNAYAGNSVNASLTYSELYQKIGNKDKAIECLLPSVFITLADNTKVIEDLRVLLREKKGVKQELDRSLQNIYTKEVTSGKYTYTYHCFKFLNAELTIPNGYGEKKNNFNKRDAIAEIQKTEFYKMIEELK
jgi:tetratricopeptide (TPR) repeat protein